MITAAAYVLKVQKNRRQILLNEWDHSSLLYEDPRIAEALPRFEHSSRAPLIVFACFSDDAITHVADGHKGWAAGTGLVRLNLRALQQVNPPILLQ
jgi:hypothetical protein